MRALDARAMDEGRMPGAILMENAGHAVYCELVRRWGAPAGRSYQILCGRGNNGGDGYVVARLLKLAGAHVHVHLSGGAEALNGDARLHHDLMVRSGVVPDSGLHEGIVVDALLGTGAKGAPRDAMARLISWSNASGMPTISVDVPSGVEADNGHVPGEAIRADVTVTFAFPKPGLLLQPGAACAGEIVVDPIGFPWHLLDPVTPLTWIRPDDVQRLLPTRARSDHKGRFGHVLVVGGSAGMGGAPAMVALAVLRSGAGLVTVALPACAMRPLCSTVPEAMSVPLADEDGAICMASWDALAMAAERASVLCVGPGATVRQTAVDTVERVAREVDRPMVIDADGLNALAARNSMLEGRRAETILTPHPGECARLLGTSVAEVEADRLGAVRAVATRFQSVAVLKGASTLVCDGRSATNGDHHLPLAINTTGNPGMATAGSGDVLTGVIGGMWAHGMDAFDAACAGVYLHGRAGDLAADELGEVGLIAGDELRHLPAAIREVQRCVQ